MRKNMVALGLVAALALTPMVALSGCAASDDVHGQTLYSVSAWDGTSYDVGDTATITFAEDSDSWHYVPTDDGYETTGTWVDEDGDIVLTSNLLGTTTLERSDDGSYYTALGDEELFGTRYYRSEEAAREYHDEYVAAAPDRVREVLESNDLSTSGTVSTLTPETVSFADGSATFTRGEYEQEGYLFVQGPAEGSWTASDHSGDYSVTVDAMRRTNMGNDAEYSGTLTIGGDAVDYSLTLTESGRVTLIIEGLTFTNG